MPLRTDTTTLLFKVNQKNTWYSLLFLVLFILASQISPLSSPSYIWDDLVWQWTFNKDGTVKLFKLLNEVGHPAFWPFLDAAFRYFGDHATLPTSLISIAFHVVNAVLIMKLMSFAGASRIQAFLVFLLYVLSPYYFNRGTVSHYFYDIFMLFFLSSVYFGVPDKQKTPARTALAVFSQGLSFGLPTLVMLEPLRALIYWVLCKGDRKKFIRSIALYWVVAVLCAVCVFFIFKPSGYYEGYNELKLEPSRFFIGLYGLLAYMPSMIGYHATALIAVLSTPWDWLIVAGILILSIYVVSTSLRKLNDAASWPASGHIILLGVLLLISGGLPYILADRTPSPWNFNSRLFYVSGVGLTLVFAAGLSLIPFTRARNFLVVLLACFFMLSNLGQAKSYLYDHSLRQEVIHGLNENQKIIRQPGGGENKDIFLVLISEPDLQDILFQNRFIAAVEFSVPFNIDNQLSDGKQFIYYYGAEVFLAPDMFLPTRTVNCSIAAHDRYPCPNIYAVAKYSVQEDRRIENVDLLDLFKNVYVNSASTTIGSFQISVPPKSFTREGMTARWYQRSAELGVPGSQNILGEMYLYGSYGMPQADKKALEWFTKAVAGGSRDARVNLAEMYLAGKGAKKDIHKALGLIQWAATEGYPRGQHRLGSLYEQGIGVRQDNELAMRWSRKAAVAGYTPAQLQLGLMYANGNGVSQNLHEALRWLRKGAVQNDMAAQYHLAMLCRKHADAHCGGEEAFKYLSKSAMQGFVPAQWQLAQIHEHGKDARDLYMSYFWYRVISNAQPSTETSHLTEKRLKEIGSKLSESDRSYLDQRARSWNPASLQGSGL